MNRRASGLAVVWTIGVIAMLPLKAAAQDAEYADAEYTATSTWFQVETAALEEDPKTGATVGCAGIWTEVPEDASRGFSARIVEGRIELNTDYTAPLSFGPVSTAEPVTKTTSRFVVTECDELRACGGMTALCVAPVGKVFRWQIWNGSSWNAGAEVASGDIGAEFEVTLETVVTNKTVKYSARKLPDGDAFDICEWTTCAGFTAPITNLSFYGSTTLGDFSGVGMRKVILKPGVQPENIEVVVIQGKPGSGLVVEKLWMQQYDKTKETMNDTAANGLTYLQSYVLGLDPTSAVAKPLVTATQNSEADKVAFRLGGVTVNTSSGARVKYRVKTFGKPDGTELEATSDPVSYEQSTLLDVPTAATPVKYYRIELSIE